MSTPAKANFTLKNNGYWERTWQIQNNGEPFDITDYTFELEIRNGKGQSATRLLQLTTGSGIEIVSPLEGKIKITIPPQPQLTAKQTFYYDLLAIKDSKSYVWLEGTIVFEIGVSFTGE